LNIDLELKYWHKSPNYNYIEILNKIDEL
jgi:hypothetical protein